MNGIDMRNNYKEVEECNAKMRAKIEQCALIKRGALLKVQNEHEQNDKLYFAQIILIYDQIDETMNAECVTLDQLMKVEKLINSADVLTNQWRQRARFLRTKMEQILKA